MTDYGEKLNELRSAKDNRSRIWTARLALAGTIVTILFGALLATDCHAPDGQQRDAFILVVLVAAIGAGTATFAGRRKMGWILPVVVALGVGVATLLLMAIVSVGECTR
jgi:hypothetical protein